MAGVDDYYAAKVAKAKAVSLSQKAKAKALQTKRVPRGRPSRDQKTLQAETPIEKPDEDECELLGLPTPSNKAVEQIGRRDGDNAHQIGVQEGVESELPVIEVVSESLPEPLLEVNAGHVEQLSDLSKGSEMPGAGDGGYSSASQPEPTIEPKPKAPLAVPDFLEGLIGMPPPSRASGVLPPSRLDRFRTKPEVVVPKGFIWGPCEDSD